eukprot:6492069-Amphidinium_carterae.2
MEEDTSTTQARHDHDTTYDTDCFAAIVTGILLEFKADRASRLFLCRKQHDTSTTQARHKTRHKLSYTTTNMICRHTHIHDTDTTQTRHKPRHSERLELLFALFVYFCLRMVCASLSDVQATGLLIGVHFHGAHMMRAGYSGTALVVRAS